MQNSDIGRYLKGGNGRQILAISEQEITHENWIYICNIPNLEMLRLKNCKLLLL